PEPLSLSLHDALPISPVGAAPSSWCSRWSRAILVLVAVTGRADRLIDISGDAPISRRPDRLGARRSAVDPNSLAAPERTSDRSGDRKSTRLNSSHVSN